MKLVGPMKRKMILSVVVTAVIIILIFSVIGFLVVSNYNKKIEVLEEAAATVTRYVLVNDVYANHSITVADLKLEDVKASNAPTNSFAKITKVSETNKEIINTLTGDTYKVGDEVNTSKFLVGRRLKVDSSKNTVLTESMLFGLDEEVTKDTRIQEFNMILLPSNLVENEYIDIRLMLPTGEDYSVLVAKKVESYVNDTIFIRLNEDEILTMGSAIIEAYMTEGAKLYANKYVNPSVQLYKYDVIDYVKKYDVAFEKALQILKDEEVVKLQSDILAEQPEIAAEELDKLVKENSKVTNTDVTVAHVVANSDLTEEIATIIKDAKEKNNVEILNKYSNFRIRTSNEIERTYAVRTEVLNAIINNPNILQEVKAGFTADRNIEEELAEIEMNAMVGITSPNEEEIQRIKSALTKELETQRNERISYLESLIK